MKTKTIGGDSSTFQARPPIQDSTGGGLQPLGDLRLCQGFQRAENEETRRDKRFLWRKLLEAVAIFHLPHL